jgi:SAM-dependent methyltransferase
MRVFDLGPDEENLLESEVGPPGFWKQTRDFQIDFLRKRGLRPEHNFLDLGCGVLRGGLPLIEYLAPGRYTGADLRESCILESGRLISEFDLTEKRPQLLSTSCFGINELEPSSFDYIWNFQLLYHLDDTGVQDCLRAISKLLRTDGVAFANVHPGNPLSSGTWKEFPFVPRPLETYSAWALQAGLRCEDLGILKAYGYPQALAGHKNHMLSLRHI